MSEEMITINVDEYQRLKKIRYAANFVIGFVSGAMETDRTKTDFRDTLESVKGRQERAIDNE